MTILFWLYKSRVDKTGLMPIVMRITIEGKRTNFRTGLKVREKSWDGDRQKIKGSSLQANKYNNVLLSLKTRAWDAYNECIRLEKPLDSEYIRQIINSENDGNCTLLQAFDYLIDNMRARVGNDLSEKTVKKYETCRRKIVNYLQVKLNRRDIFLHELGKNFIYQLDAYLQSTQGLSHNALMKNMQQFKRVIKVAVQNEWLIKDPFTSYSTALKETERGFLSDDELRALEEIALPNDKLQRVRDIFVFSCYTGLAYADVAKLSQTHLIRDENNNTWINLKRTKSKSRSLIPLLPKAEKILKKYQLTNNKHSKLLLPVISNQWSSFLRILNIPS